VARQRGGQGILNLLARHSDLALAAAVVGVLFVLVVPVPAPVIDILLTLNIACSLLLLLVALGGGKALDFNTFPSLLLFTTLFRLSMNVASTRLILLDGYAGQVINAFGNFVVGGNMVVGLIIFLVLIVIQFVVITKGSGRISEVAARFTLDAMPGKQMAIDADLNSGLLSEEEARRRREAISQEAEFYGSMDGASKFVRGDAVAGLVITAINLLGGMIMGKLNGMSVGEAAQTYSILTVGDGLVSQIPSLMAAQTYSILTVGDGLVSQIPSLIIATTAAVIVTKASANENLARSAGKQVLTDPRAVGTAAAIMLFFGLVPGLPTGPFMLLATLFFALFIALRKSRAAEAAAEPEPKPVQPVLAEPQQLVQLLQVDRMSIEVGYQLIPLLDPRQNDEMARKIGAVRRQMAQRLGVVVPPIRITDNLQLKPEEYAIRIKGQTVARGTLLPGHYLAMDSGLVQEPVEGIATSEPAFGLPALWIPADRKEAAEAAGYTVADPRSVLITHLNETIKKHAHEVLTREDVRALVDGLKERAPTIVDELVPNAISLGGVQNVLQNLLREGIPINDLGTILEAIGDSVQKTKDPDLLTEFVRKAISRTICAHVQQRGGTLGAITLDPSVEQMIATAIREGGDGNSVHLEPKASARFIERLMQMVRDTVASGFEAVLLVSSPIRRHVRRIVEQVVPDLPVLAYDELVNDLPIEGRGTVSVGE